MIRGYREGSLTVSGFFTDVKLRLLVPVYYFGIQKRQAVIHFRLYCEGNVLVGVVETCQYGGCVLSLDHGMDIIHISYSLRPLTMVASLFLFSVFLSLV